MYATQSPQTKLPSPCMKSNTRKITEIKGIYTAMPRLFQPPGPLHAHMKRPMANQTLTVMAQKVGA